MEVLLPILYAQLAVFSSDEEDPYNDWADGHLAQGFAWRPASVSFAISPDIHELWVDIKQLKTHAPSPNADRVILVPIHVKGGRGLECGNVVNTVQIAIPDGQYALFFELFEPNDAGQARAEITLTLETTMPCILKPGPDMTVPEKLLLEASPAA